MGICISKFKISNSNLNKVFNIESIHKKSIYVKPQVPNTNHKAKATPSIQFRHVSHLFVLPNKQGRHKTKQNWKWKSKKKKRNQVKTKDNKPDKKAKNKHASKLDPNTLSSAFAICIIWFFLSTGHYCTSTSPPSDHTHTLVESAEVWSSLISLSAAATLCSCFWVLDFSSMQYFKVVGKQRKL